jgi:hypothetical protein
MGTLRWQIALDARINEMLARPDYAARRRGAHRAAAGRVSDALSRPHSDHAAVMDSVELVKHTGQGLRFGHGQRAAAQDRGRASGGSSRESSRAPPRWRQLMRIRHGWWSAGSTRYGMEKNGGNLRFDQEQPPTTVRLVGEGRAALAAEGIELAPGAFLAQGATRASRRCNCDGYI